MSLAHEIARKFVRKVTEAVTYALPIAGKDNTDGTASFVSGAAGRLAMHFAFGHTGYADTLLLTASAQTLTVPSGNGRLARLVVDTGEVFVRITNDGGGANTVSASIASNETAYIADGETTYWEIDDANDAHFSVIQPSASGGNLYVKMVD